MKYFLYARKSTDEEDRQILSIEAQLTEVREYATKEKLIEAFSVLIRSKGKVSEIGSNLPIGKASKLGVERTKGSLAQTFALKSKGFTRDRDISYNVPSNLFTRPKRAKTKITENTWVERRGKTLTEGIEVRGLQQARRNKVKWLS